MTAIDTLGLRFAVPDAQVATAPPELRGLRRDGIRMLVARGRASELHHARLRDLPRWLDPGDVLVVNSSAVWPAAVDVADEPLRVHLSTRMPDGSWLVELRIPDGAASRQFTGGRRGQLLLLPGGGSVCLLAPHPTGGAEPARLWRATVELPASARRYLARHGRPIRYGAPDGHWALRHYQTIFAREEGSAEPPSAGLGFTPRLVASLAARGVEVASLVLQTGVSSQEAHEAPYAEQYLVPPATAAAVNRAAARGGRVIAVGTTVVRALETVAEGGKHVSAGKGWTDLVVTPERGVSVIDGLLTGWHEPAASHLQLLEAVAGRDLLERSYTEALEAGYLWHQFGDVHLILPERR